MGPDIYDRMHEQLKALGLAPLEAETWLELIFQISDIAKTDPEDVKGPILATIATGKMDYAALNSMQEKGVQLTGILTNLTGRGFPEVVTGGHVSSFLLKIALKQYVDDHKTTELEDLEDSEEMGKEKDLGKIFEDFFGKNNKTSLPSDASEVSRKSVEAHQAARFRSGRQSGDAHNIEIYYDRVFLDGFPVKAVQRGKTRIDGAADSESELIVTLELRAKDISIHPTFYSPAKGGKYEAS